MKNLIIFFALIILPFFTKAQTAQDSAEIKKVYISFQKYYLKNQKKFNSFKIVKGTKPNIGPPYSINWKEAERYFSFLRKNVPMVGRDFIELERKSFQEYDEHYKLFPEDEIAVGFDYDRWAGGQESVEELVKSNLSTDNHYVYRFYDNEAYLIITKPSHIIGENVEDFSWPCVPFTKENGKWVMKDMIGYFDYDKVE